MKNIKVSSGSRFEDSIGFSRAVRIGNHVAVSGTAPIDEYGATAHAGNLYLQTCRCFKIIETTLHKVGAGLNNIVRTRVLLTDISKWEEAAKAHGEYFSTIKPACTFAQVSAFINKDWLVEIEVDAMITEE